MAFRVSRRRSFHLIIVFDTLSNYEGCLKRSSEANLQSPPTPYNELVTVLVKLQFLVNRLLVSVRGSD